MDFEEMKAIWNTQSDAGGYKIDEKELYGRVLAKKGKTLRIANFTELMIIGVYAGVGIFVLVESHMYYLAAWMWMVALVLLISRVRRLRAARRFDRTIQGELQHALAVAKYQVRVSQLMRWNILPIALFCLWGSWEGGKSVWGMVFIVLVFVVTFYASGFEHRMYVRQKEALEALERSLNE